MAHPDFDQLMNVLLPFAQQMLSESGAFFPFGWSMKSGGEFVSVGAWDGDEHPQPQRLIDLMTQQFRKEAAAGQLRAAGLCFDGRTIPPGQSAKQDAIGVSLEHQSGQAIDAFVPYKKGWLGKIRYGELFAARRNPQFFMQSGRQE